MFSVQNPFVNFNQAYCMYKSTENGWTFWKCEQSESSNLNFSTLKFGNVFSFSISISISFNIPRKKIMLAAKMPYQFHTVMTLTH